MFAATEAGGSTLSSEPREKGTTGQRDPRVAGLWGHTACHARLRSTFTTGCVSPACRPVWAKAWPCFWPCCFGGFLKSQEWKDKIWSEHGETGRPVKLLWARQQTVMSLWLPRHRCRHDEVQESPSEQPQPGLAHRVLHKSGEAGERPGLPGRDLHIRTCCPELGHKLRGSLAGVACVWSVGSLVAGTGWSGGSFGCRKRGGGSWKGCALASLPFSSRRITTEYCDLSLKSKLLICKPNASLELPRGSC